MARFALDSLVNFLSRLGTVGDKNSQNTYGFAALTRQQLENAYRADWIARKIVDIPAFDSVRAWRDWQADHDDIETIEDEEKRLDVNGKLRRAMTRSRLYGGGALILGVGDGNAVEPLDVESVRQGDLRFVHVVSPHEISTGDLGRDLLGEFYGEPTFYEVNSVSMGQVRIHPSRVIRFLGNEAPDPTLVNGGWGDSVLQVVDDAVKNAGVSAGGIATLIHEAKLDVIKVPGLTELLATREGEERLTRRFAYAGEAKSLVSTLILDKDEEWQRITTNFSGFPELIRTYLQIAAGAADIPATRLVGQAPTGMNATGDSDIRNYYDRISSEQNNVLRPTLARLDDVLIRSAFGQRPDAIYYEWGSLWQLDEKERAEVADRKAKVFQIDVNAGVIPDFALATARVNQLIEDGTYPGLESAIEDAGGMDPADFDEPDPETVIVAADPAAIPEAGQRPSARRPAAVRRPPPRDQQRRDRRQASGERTRTAAREGFADATPRTLYVQRKVLNGDDIKAWAKGQGLATTLPADELHVTIAFSRAPVDWMKIGSHEWAENERGELIVKPGGARVVEPLGPKGAIVLLFNSSELGYRHEAIKRYGASWEWDDFQPHITLTSDPPVGLNLADIEPYRGKIVLGPEIFEEIDDDRSARVIEDRALT